MTGRHLAGALLTAVFLVVASCAEDRPAEGGGGGEPSITVVNPADGAEVASPVMLQLSVDGAEIGSPDTGLMHFHVYVGDSDDYEVITNLSSEVPAPKGLQTLRIVLAEPNHTETDVNTTVSVDVTSGAGGAGGGGYGGDSRYGGGDDAEG